jgi:stearoyl-CoA desaturase (delta-9 desaturase)
MEPVTHRYGRKAAKGINWITVIAMTAFHIGAFAALFYVDLGAMLVAAFLWWVTGMLGIGMGYHRLLTHRGYKTPKWVEYVLTTCGVLALEGGPIFWVATHRIHHQHSDHEGDPHTPREGTYWAHIGWIFAGQAMHHDTRTLKRYVPDLSKDAFHVWISNWHWVPQVVVGVALLAIGGWPYVLWGTFFRTTYGLHATWLVNSATHIWGRRRFKTRDDSTNNWWVALLTWGEGWHNNHHAHPVSARHGLAWYELDMNYIGIKTLQAVGLAWDIRVANLTHTHHQVAKDGKPAHTHPGLSPDAVDVGVREPVLAD